MEVAGNALVVFGVSDVGKASAIGLLYENGALRSEGADLLKPRFGLDADGNDQLANSATGPQRLQHWVPPVQDLHATSMRNPLVLPLSCPPLAACSVLNNDPRRRQPVA